MFYIILREEEVNKMKRNNKYNLNKLGNEEIFELILIGGVGRLPSDFWDKEGVIEAVKWIIEEKYKCSDEDIKSNLWSKIFTQYRLTGQIYKYYNSIYDLINEIYPNRFKPWEMKKISLNFWNKERIIEATKWMIEEKLQWTEEDIKNNLTLNIFKKYIMPNTNQIYRYYNSIYDLINEIYPNRFKPWEMKNVPNNFWTKEGVIEATKWMIEEKLTEEELERPITIDIFRKYKLGYIANNKYDIQKLLDEVYPGKFVNKKLVK